MQRERGKEKKVRKERREERGREVRFPLGKLGHCAAEFLRFMGIRGHVPKGALNF